VTCADVSVTRAVHWMKRVDVKCWLRDASDGAVAMTTLPINSNAMLSGRVNAGYRIRDGEWQEIGRMSPQKPQVYRLTLS